MDLSIKRPVVEETEIFDYRHKKFGQVRSTPLENERNLVSPTNFYLTTQNELKSECHERDQNWELQMDELNMPSTPLKRRRVSKRKTQNINHDVCPNAPKKRKVQGTAEITPAKTCKLATAYATPALPVLMPKISTEALTRICQYNKNMVRKFPKKERSAKDQERRDKNTIACRMSRRLKKLENLAIEEQYKIFVQEHLEQQKRSIQAAVYLNELIKSGAQISNEDELHDEFLQTISKNLDLKYLQKREPAKMADFEMNSQEAVAVESVELAAQQKRPFTIAFLLGGSQQK